MAIEKKNGSDETQVRKLIERWVESMRARDVDALVSLYAPDVVSFDLPPPLRNVGAEDYRTRYAEWFSSWRGPIGSEIRELRICAGDDVAFSHCLNRISGKRTDGEHTDVWVRATVCYRKIDGAWLVTHEHISVPFYMEPPFRAAVDLAP
jgi:uncharacterized protein (TIGR02246 family)